MPRLRLLAAGMGLLSPFAGAIFALAEGLGPMDLLHRLSAGPVVVGPLGWLAMILLQVGVAASGLLPASLVGVAAGMLCGTLNGFMLAALCIFGGAMVTFAAARRLSAPILHRLFSNQPRLQAFEALLLRDGWRFVCLLRLSPVIPFAATSYMLGVSKISLRDYAIGTCASLPALAGYVLAGAFLGHVGTIGSTGLDRLSFILFGLGVAATVVLTLRVGQLAGRALKTSGAVQSEGC